MEIEGTNGQRYEVSKRLVSVLESNETYAAIDLGLPSNQFVVTYSSRPLSHSQTVGLGY